MKERGFTPMLLLVGVLIVAAITGRAYYIGVIPGVKPIQPLLTEPMQKALPTPTAIPTILPTPKSTNVLTPQPHILTACLKICSKWTVYYGT